MLTIHEKAMRLSQNAYIREVKQLSKISTLQISELLNIEAWEVNRMFNYSVCNNCERYGFVPSGLIRELNLFFSEITNSNINIPIVY